MNDTLPKAEADTIRDEVIRRMANTPPKAKPESKKVKTYENEKRPSGEA